MLARGFPGGSEVKASVCNVGDPVQSLGREDPLEKKMATHSSILPWKIPWREKREVLTTEEVKCFLIPHLFKMWVEPYEGFPGGSVVKSSPAVQESQETQVRSLGWEDPLEEEMATHLNILAWKIPWTELSGGLQFLGVTKNRRWLSMLTKLLQNNVSVSLWCTIYPCCLFILYIVICI